MLDAARPVRVEFVDCGVSGAVLSDARLDDVRFVDCRCHGLLLRMSNLKRSEFLRCDITNAEFYESGLQHAGHASRVRFVPTATFADPWVDACRSLILIALGGSTLLCQWVRPSHFSVRRLRDRSALQPGERFVGFPVEVIYHRMHG